MSVHAVAPVEEQPRLTLEPWTVYETETGELHLVGHCLETGEGRVSSAIIRFDPKTMTAVTRSGRLYLLQGTAGLDDDAVWVWQFWATVNGVKSATDVGGQLIAMKVGLETNNVDEETGGD